MPPSLSASASKYFPARPPCPHVDCSQAAEEVGCHRSRLSGVAGHYPQRIVNRVFRLFRDEVPTNVVIGLFLFSRAYSDDRVCNFFAIDDLERRSNDSGNRSFVGRDPDQDSDILDVSLDVAERAVERVDPQADVLALDFLVDGRLRGQYVAVELRVVVLDFSLELCSLLSDDGYVGKVQLDAVDDHLLDHEVCLDRRGGTSVTRSPGPFS